MATISKDTLVTVIRNEYFSDNVLVTSAGTITNINCTPNFSDASINVQISTASVTISGNNLGIVYIDTTKYIEKGSSGPAGDNVGEQSVSEVIGIDKVPSNKEMFEFNQDLKDDVIRTYNLSVTETVGIPAITTTTNFVLTQTIRNNWSFGKPFIENYFGLPSAT